MQDQEAEDKAICADCVGESYLSDEISREGVQRLCHYCGETGCTFTIPEMAERIERAFDKHYTRTRIDPDGFEWAMQKDPEIDYEWERAGEQTIYAIMNAANIPEQAAGDIQAILADENDDFDMAAMGEETAFADDVHYEEIMPGDEEWQEGWRFFERTIRSEARFFSRTAATQLSALFDDIDQLRTHDGSSLIVDAGPATNLTHFYRARVFQSDEKLKVALMRPDLELSAPPSSLAAAGRMNAKGISAFYGATDQHIAVAEVRPPVGSQVAIGRFEVMRPLRLLDLNKLEHIRENGSIFDPGYAARLGRMMFLRKLCGRMSRPVMPDDQDFEYLATQAIADFLASEGKVPLDGIIFPSVQAGNEGVNVVLFHKASRAKEMDIPKGTKLEAGTWQDYADGPEREYTVTEHVPERKAPKRPKIGLFDPSAFDWHIIEENYDDRPVTLKIEPAGVKVHVIEAVSFKTNEYDVTRHRWPKVGAKDAF